MIAYAPNISWLFPDLSFAQRPRAVAEAGFEALEFGFYGPVDIRETAAACRDLSLQVVLFNMDIPSWNQTHRGFLADSDLRDEFKKRLDEALEVAVQLSAHKLMLPVGIELPDRPRQAQIDCIIANLNYAASLAADACVMLTIEAMNPWDMPGYFLTSSSEGIDIIRQTNHPQVKFQFDTYHLQRLEGNLIRTLVDNIDFIGHIQFGDVPGRSEPGTGELNFSNLTIAAEKAGYEGYIGLEYNPVSPGAEALAWVPPERRSAKRGRI